MITLSNGVAMPQIGLGVWQVEDNSVMDKAVRAAFDAGYTHFDTAQAYNNEHMIGEALAAYGNRQDYFLTTKLTNPRQGEAAKAFEESLKHLKTDYVDQFLIHWPSPTRGLYVDAWKELVKIYQDGRAKSIGVSNFGPHHIEKIVDATGFVPHVNQVERHPLYQQNELAAHCRRLGISMVAYSPLATGHMDQFAGKLAPIAQKHGKSTAQIILRWQIQTGWVALPKSVTPSRIAENIDILGFSLDDGDLALIASLDCGTRFLPDADSVPW